MAYKYSKELSGGTIVHYKGVPVELMHAVLIGTNTNLAAVDLGSIRSEKKAATARENGKKGGRPKIK